MSDIPPINGSTSPTSVIPPRQAGRSTGEVAQDQEPDSVEISDVAMALSEMGPDTTIRVDKVNEIRQAIANGSYETPDKIDYTVSRLLDIFLPIR